MAVCLRYTGVRIVKAFDVRYPAVRSTTVLFLYGGDIRPVTQPSDFDGFPPGAW